MTDMPVYRYVPHHLTEAKLAGQVPGPVKATDQLPRGNPAARFNAWFAGSSSRPDAELERPAAPARRHGTPR